MHLDNFVIFLTKFLFIFCVFSAVASSVEGGGIRRKRQENYAEPGEEEEKEIIDFASLNICDIQDPTIVYCYCNTPQFNEADEGNCWIFGDTSANHFADVWESFASQTKMKRVRLHLRTDGTLREVPTVAIRFLPDLKTFEVEHANIDSVHSFAFGNSSSIERITIARNAITTLEAYSFANLPSLTTLGISENAITGIRKKSFYNLPKLRQLYIDKNNITEIDDFAFQELGELRELEIFSNLIEAIVPETFKGLYSLERLDLHKNNIQEIGDFTFQDLKSLTELNLMANSIKYLAPKGLKGLSKLTKLILNDNKLISLVSGVFKPTKNLLFVDLRQNVLETLTEENIKPFFSNLRNESMHVYLKDNIFRCDSRLTWMLKLYNNTKSSSLKASLEKIACYLEAGTLPRRFHKGGETGGPGVEIAMGIGPRIELMKLLPSELPEPLVRSEASDNCRDDAPAFKGGPKKRQGKSRENREGGNKQLKTTTLEENSPGAQNDMASAEDSRETNSDTQGSNRQTTPTNASPHIASNFFIYLHLVCILNYYL